MLLTNWLNALTSRIKKRPTFRSRDRRDIRKRWQAAISNQISTTEVLEDRTLLTTFFVDDDFSALSNGDSIAGTDTDPVAAGDQNAVVGTTAFDTIQEAIDAANAGDIINVAAGTYNPASTITVSQSVTIQGPQAGVDPRPGSGSLRDHTDASTEAIIDGGGALSQIFLIDADNVTLDGLVITNGTGDLIRSSNGVSQAIVQYNIIHNSSGDEGVQLAQTSNSSIQYNYIFDTTGDGANFAESSNGNISFNELNNIRSTNGAIYVYDSEAITIEGNYLDLGHLNLNDGIKVTDDIGADTTTTYIINNVVIDSLQDAINAERSNVVISGNDVSGSRSENGVIYVSEGVDNIQITNNSIHDNLTSVTPGQINYAIRIGKGSDFPTNVVVRDNSIVNNDALIFFRQDSQANLDAARNWWGTIDHTVIAAGIVGVVDGLGVTNGEIDFSTILTSGIDTDGVTAGFQPDTSSLLVHDLGGDPANGSRIQNAISAVDDNGAIEIQVGTYSEDVTVDRGITLSGTPDIQGTLTVTDGATLAPGFSPGILSSGDLSFATGTSLDIEIEGTTPGPGGHDQINVTGTVMIDAGVTLNLIDGLAGPGTSGDTIVFINNDGSDAVVSEFAGLANGSAVAFNGETWNIFYNGGDGNDVVLVLLSESEIFVNDDFTGPDGTVIVDADPNTVGNQHAIIGVNAFDTIQEGVDAVAVGGTVHITDQTGDAGTYVENVTIMKDITLRGTSGVDGDVTITPPAGDGITVSAAATSATIENLTVTGATGVGILLTNLTGDVLLTNVTSTSNDIGVVASNVNNFTDIDGTYQNNNNSGILVEDITNNVTLTRTLMEDNNADGDIRGEGFTALADINSESIGGNLLVEGITARDSDGAGSAADQLAAVFVEGVGGNATFQDSTGVVQSVLVEDHALDGIVLQGVAGDTNLTNVTSINNGFDSFGPGGDGIAIIGAGSITDTDGTYSGNVSAGIFTLFITGDVRLNRTTLEDNNADDFGPGAGFFGGGIDGNFIAEGVTIRDTDGAGLAAFQRDGVLINGITGDITFQDSTGVVQSVTIEGHDEFGVFVEALTSPASVVTFTNGTYSNNAEDGIHIDFVDGTATFTNVTVENNGGDGLQLFQIFGNIDINGGSFGSNHENGIEIEDAADVTLTNVTSSSNLHAGIEVAFVDSFSDTDGIYQANEDAGIHLFDILGDVDLTRTILEDNNADDGDFGDGFTAVPYMESVAIGGDLTINGLTARSTNPGITHQTAGVYVEGVDGSVVIDGSTDAVTISGNEEEGISLIDVVGDVTLIDVSLTANAFDSFVGGATIFNIDTTTGNVIDHFDINTPALGGEGFLQHTRGGVVQDIIETDNIGTLDIDFDAGDDTVTVLPHSTTLIDLNGGDPTIATGDVLTYITPVGETATNTPAGLDGGTISSTGGFADVVFDEFENLSIPGPLVVTGTSGDDLLIITATNANSGTYQIITDGVPGVIVNFSDITDFTFDGLEGDDTLRIVNPAGGVFDPINGVFFNGGTGGEDGAGDTLEILGGTATSVEHRFVDDASGSVLFNGEVIGTITYTGLEPVIDLVATPDRIFSYSGADDVITLSDAGVAGQTFIDSTFGESVTFLNPTATFTINAGAGNDIVDVNSLDANFSASLTINGDYDNDTINVNSAISFDTGNTVEFNSDLINVDNGVTITASGITFNGTTVELDGDLVSSNVAGDVSTVNVLGSTGGAEIQDAIDIAGNGGIINVAAGSYITTGTLDVNESVSILGAGRDVVEILKMDDPAGNFDEAIDISADNVTISGAQLGWEVHTSATDYQGYVVVTTADNTTLTDLLFEDNYRSAIVFIGANNLEVSDSIFDGKFGRAAIRDGNGGAGENFLITRNEFRADHFRWGPISIGPQGSGGASGAYSGEISFNYFGNGLETGSFQEEGDRNYTVTITNPGLTAAGLDIIHNTFDWQDSAVTNGDGNFGQPGGIFFDPSISLAPNSVDISDNIFSGFTFDGPQPSTDPLWNPTGGQFGGALEFDGVDDFGIFQSALFDVGTAGTLNFWVNMHDQSQRNQFFEGLNDAGFEFQFRENSGGQFFGSPGRAGNTGSNFAIQDGNAGGTEGVWQNLQYTWDFNGGVNPEMHIYIDGVEVGYFGGFDSDLTGEWLSVVSTVSQLITVGRDASGNRHFDGLMDDVGWFNAALDMTDRDNIRTNGVAVLTGDPRLIAHWDFDQAAGNIAVDNENDIQMFLSANGISPLGPVFQPTGGQFGGALEFDGLDDFATFQDAAFDVGEQGTLNFWVNMSDTSRRNQFFEGPGDGGLEFQYREHGGGQFFGRTQDGADFTIQDGGAAGVQGVWTNVQYTWDATTGEMRIYLDGSEVTYLAGYDQNLAGFDINNFTETLSGLMSVGRDPGDGSRFFAGLMDDIGWFDGVLNQTDRDDIRTNGVANRAGDPRLVAHWDLDDAPGTMIAPGNSGTSIDLHIQAEPPTPPIGGFGVIAPLDASITNNLFFDNDNDSNHVLDPSNKLGVDPLFARDHDPAFNPATTSLEEIFAIGLGSPAAFMSTEFAGDPATTTPHIGAFQDLAPFGAGDIVINGSNADDLLEIVFTSETEAMMTLTTDVGGLGEVVTGPISLTNITSFTFNGLEGDDILRITNPAGGLLNPTNGLFFNGGTGGEDGAGDTLEILGGVATSVEHRFVDNASGSILFDGEGVATITYTGLEPVLDTIVATNRTFSFLGGAETITLSDDGVVGDGVSQIDSDNFGEVVAFLNATDSVTINTEAFGGSGVDAVNIEGLDSTFDADLTVNGGLDDTVTFQTNATDLGSGDLTVDIGNVVLDQDVTTTGNADLNASGGSITDGGSSAADALTADSAILTATFNVGGAGDAVDIDVANLEANAGNDINLNNNSGATLTIGGISGLIGLGSQGGITLTTDDDLQIDKNIAGLFGNIDIESTTGGITMLDGTLVSTNGVIELTADGDIALSIVSAAFFMGEARITSNNGAITDNTALQQTLISGENVVLRAATGIGAADEIDVATTTLAADSTTGVINLFVSDAVTIGTVDGLSGISGADAITLVVGGTVTVNENISSSGAAPINVTSGMDIDVNATIQSNGGTIDLLAFNDLNLGATSVVDTISAADVTLIADNDASGGGSFTQTEGGVVDAGGGTLDVTSTGDARIADLRSVGGTVLVEAFSGSIIDNTAGESALITANAAGLGAADSVGGAGSDDINIAVSTLNAGADTGSIDISNTGALTIGTVVGLGFVGGVTADGAVNVSASSPLTVSNLVFSGSGELMLSATDSAGAGDDLTIDPGVTIQAFSGNVVLNAGDNFTMDATSSIIATTTIEINVDPSAGDPDAAGAIVDLLGNVDATQTTINGGDDADTFNILPTADSPITVNGGDPTLPGPGDVLNMDFSGLANAPFLTLGATPDSGSFGFIAPDLEQTVDFTSIENVNNGGTPFHLVLDMFAAGFQDAADDTIDVQLDGAGTNLLIDVNASNIFSRAVADILSFTVIGSADNETLNINESPGGLPLFQAAAPAIPGSNGSHLNAAADTTLENLFNPTTYDADDITIHYDGGAGTDDINVNFTTEHAVGYFADNLDSPGSGNIFAFAPFLDIDIDLGLSFGSLEGVGINGTNDPDPGSVLVVDASSTPLTTTVNINDDGTPADGVSQITANGGFTNMVFSGFRQLSVVSGTGEELIDLIALDSATTVTQIDLSTDDVFDSDTANDTIRVRSTPTGVTDVLIRPGLGDDLIQIFDAGNTVDNIFADINVEGEGGNDTLTIIDSGDVTGDTFEVTSTTIDGLSSAAGTDVTFFEIDNLNITGTGGNDIINVNLGQQEDLDNATINGDDGNDIFNVQPSQATEITINGGNPQFGDVGVPPGDTLNFDPLGNTFNIVGKTIFTAGGMPDPYKPVNFVSIESLPLEPIGPDTLRFDLDGGDLETQAGYTSVAGGQVYGSGAIGSDFGWVGGSVSAFDRGNVLSSTFENLLQDGHYGTTPRTFRADVTNGWYLVSVKIGDAIGGRDNVRVTDADSGNILLDSVTSAVGQFEAETFVVQVLDGSLDLEFSDLGGNRFWVVNGIEIRPAEILTIGTPDPGPLAADGGTIDTFTGYEATPGSLVTISTTHGEVTSTDLDADIAGIQVLADAFGEFTYHIRRPTGGVNGLVKMEEVTGEQTGCLVIEYVLPNLRRFDFNNLGSPTQEPVNGFPAGPTQEPGGYIGIEPADLYSSDIGFGWVTTGPAVSFDRGPGLTGAQSDLRRDGHYDSVAREFQVDLPNGTYYVNVTIGDQLGARDNIRVRNLDTAADLLPDVDTAAGEFFHDILFPVTVTDGSLNLEFSDLGGNSFWVLNGLEIRPDITAVNFNAIGAQPADGGTDNITGTASVADGTLLTITTDIGTILSDASSEYAGTQVVVTGGAFSFDIQSPVSDGIPTIVAEAVDGSARGEDNTVVSYTAPAVDKLFDLNRSPTQAGYTGVLASDLYDPVAGYGWVTNAARGADRGALAGSTHSDLLRDIHYGTGGAGTRTFQADLAASTEYEVTVTFGDSSARDNMTVEIPVGFGTGVGLNDVDTTAGQYSHRTFTATTNGSGNLQLEFSDAGGDAYWTISGIAFRVAATVGDLTVDATDTGGNPVAADGATEDTFTVTGATVGALYTISTTSGTITTADADPRYAGVQVLAGAGSFTFDVLRPGSGGIADILVQEVSGAADGAVSQEYTEIPVRRFDFNGRSNETAAGFTGVRGNELYDPVAGYGWASAVRDLDRGASGYTVTTVDLYRDGAYGYAGAGSARTFQISVTPGTEYEVRVYVGDRIATRDNMEFRADGVTVIADIDAPANTFATASFTYTAGDSILDLEIRDNGGDFYWVFNGVDIAETATGLPPAAPLLIDALSPPATDTPESLTSDELALIADAAIARWNLTGLTQDQLTLLQNVELRIDNLDDGRTLGLAGTRQILIDDDAAGYGWFVDQTPYDNLEFDQLIDSHELQSRSGSAALYVDLLTVVMHELGHVLGLDDIDSSHDPNELMSDRLAPGIRRLANAAASGVATSGDDGNSEIIPIFNLGDSSDQIQSSLRQSDELMAIATLLEKSAGTSSGGDLNNEQEEKTDSSSPLVFESEDEEIVDEFFQLIAFDKKSPLNLFG